MSRGQGPRAWTKRAGLGLLLAVAVPGCVIDDGTLSEPGEPGLPDASDAIQAIDIFQQFDNFDTGLFGDADGGLFGELPFVGECDTGADCVLAYGELEDPCREWMCAMTTQSCVIAEAPDGKPCDDHNACTLSTACSAGFCLLDTPGAVLDCFDANPCTDDQCDPAEGCVYFLKSGTPCDDGDPCTQGDHCLVGECVGQTDICPAQCGNGVCEVGKGESCASCPLDCGPCSDGCEPSESPSCGGCPCESCVCELIPACCSQSWTQACADLCGSAACGGTCTGCEPRALPTCHGCECEGCVCDLEPSCCVSGWAADCAALCADECDGCR